MSPRISICVPNLNTRPFLEERFETVFAQSLRDWELLAYDSYSTDGSWELIQALAAREPRMRAWQGPRAGTPGSWTPCVREARGEYVYIATSDDTMPPDCLEKLAAALDAHPDCDIAHCPLRPIDEQGRDVPATQEWWLRGSIFAQSSGALLSQEHVRRAPFDGLLHLLGGSVYVSITQLLVRRTLFDRIGYFESTWGSISDLNWSMRAGLAASTVHVPDTWGGWRVHSGGATAAVHLQSAEHGAKVDSMIADAIDRCGTFLEPTVRDALVSRWAGEAEALRALFREVAGWAGQALVRRRARLLLRACRSAAAREYVMLRLSGAPESEWVRRRLAACGGAAPLLPASATAPSRARPSLRLVHH